MALRNEINFVHPTAKIHPSTQLGSNVYINADVEIGANCSIVFKALDLAELRMRHSACSIPVEYILGKIKN